MQYRTPSLDVYQQVTNIGAPELDGIKRELPNDSEPPVALQRTVHKLLSPSRPLVRAGLLDHVEVGRVQHFAGLQGVDESHIDKLGEHLEGTLADFSCEGPIEEVPALPTDVQPMGKGSVLTIGAAPELSQRRAILKGAIVSYYNLEQVPDYVWIDEELMARVWLARSFNPAMGRLLTRMDTTLTHKSKLLPASLRLGEVVVAPHPSRDR